MALQTPKGTRDILPEDKIVRDQVVSVLKSTFESFGYNPLETPALEYYEVLANKFTGGEEILKEMYTLTDNADRKLGLRYDLTVPFARVIAMNPERKKPFKRYQIDRVWRNGPIKLGRYREFWQCDVDVVGISNAMAEAELLVMASQVFEQLGIDALIGLNNRKTLDALLVKLGVNEVDIPKVVLSLDKLAKVGFEGVKQELQEKDIDDEIIDDVLTIFEEMPGTNSDVLKYLKDVLGDDPSLKEIEELLSYIELAGVTNVQLDIRLARGLSYYTGFIWEVFAQNSPITSSIASGGRYDNMIGNILKSKETYPAVGLSFGLDVIADVIGSDKEKRQTVTDFFIIPLKTTKECFSLIADLRTSGLKCDMDYLGRNMKKNLNYANGLGIPFVIIVGENELKEQKVSLKNMETGEEKLILIKELATYCKSLVN